MARNSRVKPAALKHDALRQRCFQIAMHLEMCADLERAVVASGLPAWQTPQKRAAANEAFLRGEADLLRRAAEEIEDA